jgi:hypothetical protein
VWSYGSIAVGQEQWLPLDSRHVCSSSKGWPSSSAAVG